MIEPAQPTHGVRLRELGDRIKAAMGSMSSRELARKSGVSAATVDNLLRGYLPGKPGGTWRPTAANVMAVVGVIAQDHRSSGDAFTVAVALELAGYEPRDYVTPVEVGPPLLSESALARKIVHLSLADRRAIETLVESLHRAYDTGK